MSGVIIIVAIDFIISVPLHVMALLYNDIALVLESEASNTNVSS